jgi:type II secretion system protein H
VPRCRAPGRPGRAGFTLIEVVIVTAVMAILLMASLPRFQQSSERLRVEQRAFEFAQLLRYARERAVTQSRDTFWVWDDDARRAHLAQADELERLERLEERGAESAELAPGVMVLVDADSPPARCDDCVQFLPDGTATAATVTITRDELAYSIAVDGATGRATVSAGAPAR